MTRQQGQNKPLAGLNLLIELLLVWLLTLPALTPLLQPHTLTDSADGLLHLYRLVALKQAVGQGAFFPRWLPDLAYGYGLPLFVFYAPLSYYLTLLLALPGLGLVNAFNASMMLAWLLAAAGVYLLARDWFGPAVGLLAAIAYAYAPIQMLNNLSRGSLPAAWAMAAYPFVFWAFGRLIHSSPRPYLLSTVYRLPSTVYLPLSALLLGAALLMHNVPNLLFAPLLALYVGLELLGQLLRFRNDMQPKQLAVFFRQLVLPVILAVILGFGLAAFYLLPALVEKQFVHVERVITSPDFDFRFNFLSPADLLALPQAANTGLLNPTTPFTLGVAQVGLALVGWLGLRRLRKNKQWVVVIFALTGLAGSILMMLPLSLPVWERLPLLAFIQHPYRLLGPAALTLALLGGLTVLATPARWRLGVTLTGILLLFLTSLPLLYPRYQPPLTAEPTLLDMMSYEHASGAIGATSFGEYLPRWVKQTPRESPLEPLYQAGAAIERLDPTYLPPTAKIEAASYGFNQADLLLDAPQPYQAIFNTFYFPGWTALADGQPAPLAPVTERGLIGVTMPAGRHRLQLYFAETPLRQVADIVSLVSLAVVAALFIRLASKLSTFCFKIHELTRINTNKNLKISENSCSFVDKTGWSRPGENTLRAFTSRQLVLLAGLGLALIVLNIGYVDRFDTPFNHTFDGVRVAGAGVSRQVNFGGQVNLLGYTLDRAMVVSGQSFALTAYWQARQPLLTNYSSLAQLVDAERHLYAGQDNLHPGLMTTRWQPWGFAQDSHRVPVPPGTPPGDYVLAAGLYDPSSWARLPVLDGGDPGWADTIAIPVTVTKAAQPPAVEELDIAWPIMEQTSQVFKTCEVLPVQLLGATPERDTIRPNDFLRVALFWEAVTAPTINYRISLRLVNQAGAVALEETNQPSFDRYPTTRWAAGERVRDNHALWIPPDFAAGTYRLHARVLDEAGQPLTEWLELGQVGL